MAWIPSYDGMTTSRKSGFTLIELSIVLVIIGLLVGGVLVGKDLIKASEIRSQVSQMEQLDTATTIFKMKYNGIPGDLVSTDAASFGLFSVDPVNNAGEGYGDGNGFIEAAGSSVDYPLGEAIIFWRHLSEAKLINGSYSTTTGTAIGNIDSSGWIAVAATNVTEINAHLPPAKIGRGASLTVGSLNHGSNYYALAGINYLDMTYFQNSTNPLTAGEASSIDIKLDDGNPSSGTVRAINRAGGINPRPGALVAPIASCVTSGAYVVSGTTQSCSLKFKLK